MLENLSRSLLDSLECFAREEMDLWLRDNETQRRYYVPIVVTNARLSVCRNFRRKLVLPASLVNCRRFVPFPSICQMSANPLVLVAGAPFVRPVSEAGVKTLRCFAM